VSACAAGVARLLSWDTESFSSERLPMIVAIAGASGFVGRALTAHLVGSGHDVVALGRSVGSASRDARAIAVDVSDEAATANALVGVEVAYYLVHSMAAGGGFREVDLRLATAFGRAAAQAGVGRIIYVGALGDAPSSAHLASRHEVGSALAAAGVAVIELRAAVVFGSGSISFEMLRYLTERLPAMVCPRWVRTRIQPIALDDLLAYLEQSLHVAPGIYEIGGADVTTYREMISAYARVRGLRPRRIIDIPWLTPHLSSYWVDLVTPVDRSVSHALIESLVTEVVVVDPEPARRAFSVTPMGVERALAAALDDQDEEVTRSLFARRDGLVDGVYSVVVDVAIPTGTEDVVVRDLRNDRRAAQLVRRCARVDGSPCPRAPRRRTPSTAPARSRGAGSARRLVAHRLGRVGPAGAAERRMVPR
jgi:uncharacterized protein YbjT (DUF2867 family)